LFRHLESIGHGTLPLTLRTRTHWKADDQAMATICQPGIPAVLCASGPRPASRISAAT
jgi:hypothetical protein